MLSRREFIKDCSIGSASMVIMDSMSFGLSDERVKMVKMNRNIAENSALDLSPARWIWYPSQRCLQNTFVLFRKQVNLARKPKQAKGWILADSRYLLFVNGQRIQWGPAPFDPRWPEADPVDLSEVLTAGKNVIAAQVLYYGQGDGTWPIGKPGFIFRLDMDEAKGKSQQVCSDESWLTHLARCWRPGHYKRWYLRSLQEEFDARLYPYGWSTTEFEVNEDWRTAMELNCPADKPSICSTYAAYQYEIRGDRESSQLRRRSIPMLGESKVPARTLVESHQIKWLRPAEEYFESLTPDAYEVDPASCVNYLGKGAWHVQAKKSNAAVLTFDFDEQIVGWPYFTIDTPEGTIVELLVQEAHNYKNLQVMNNHFHSWTRFICKEGRNRFECFDYESLRWLQLHIRGTNEAVVVRAVGVRRRIFPWPQKPKIICSDQAVQKLAKASINTLHNCAQETLVDGMGRERQQYSGDVGHQLHGIFYAFGESRLPARYLNTFSQGLTMDGYFLDCWPAYDRLARLMERQLHLTKWGPLLDHGVGFNFDCYHYYLYTGDSQALTEVFPRLLRFFQYLTSILGPDNLLPVENFGTPAVWLDHDAYERTRHKQCAFNLYAAAMTKHALAPLCRAFGETAWERRAKRFSQAVLKATQEKFWDFERGLFVNNLPWFNEEKNVRLCDRSLATAILFDQCPGGKTQPALRALTECPPEMGFSYPANAGWRLWALAKGGRIDVVLNDFRTRWMNMDSVTLNNTLQEGWTETPDDGSVWSHCPVAPLYLLYMSIAGIQPLEPGFARYQLRPQLGDIEHLELTAETKNGPIQIQANGRGGERELVLETPPKGKGELLLDKREKVALEKIAGEEILGLQRYALPAARSTKVRLRHT